MFRRVASNILVFAIAGLGALILISFARSLLYESNKIANWGHSGVLQSDIRTVSPDSTLILSDVDPVDVVSGVTPDDGDTLLTIEGMHATGEVWDSLVTRPIPIGAEFTIQFEHHGVQDTAVFRATALPTQDFISLLTLHVLRFLIALAFIAVGLWALLKRYSSGGVRALALFSFSMAASMLRGISYLNNSYATLDLPLGRFSGAILDGLIAFLGASWLNLQMLFPKPTRLIARHPGITYVLIYLPIPLLYLMLKIYILPSPYALLILALATLTQVVIGFVLLALSHRRATTSLELRQSKLVLLSAGVGLAPMILLLVVGSLFPAFFASLGESTVILLVNIVFFALLMMPLSYFYAFNRYGLMEVEAKLRRGTRYLLVTGVLLAILFVIVLAASGLLVRQLGITDRTPVLVLAIVLALGVTPAQRRLQRVIERSIFPERYKLRNLVQEFLQRAASLPDRRTLWESLIDSLEEGLRVDPVLPLLLTVEGKFVTTGDREVPLEREGGLVRALVHEHHPIFIDEAVASRRIEIQASERNWLHENQVIVIVPLISGAGLEGMIALGPKEGDEEYHAEEIQILNTLASQVALAAENLRLLEENLEKRRLEDELQMARNIQEGFLPRRIPETPGLEIAAKSHFCLEVAGDYYDIVALKDGRTVLAVGDVSGKGAGAAMIMANLQASLRALVNVDARLKDLTSGINDIICRNTPPEAYVTFFVAVYDPKESRLDYVNAGHNPPMLMRSDGTLETLDKGGMILGVIPDAKYESASLTLETGSLILLYTDGVTEAMNADGEEYGEERLAHMLSANRSLSSQDLADCVEKSVVEYSGSESFQDDFTLLIVRTLES